MKLVRFCVNWFVYSEKKTKKIKFRLRLKKQPSRVNVLNKMLRFDRMRKFILDLCNDVMDLSDARV